MNNIEIREQTKLSFSPDRLKKKLDAVLEFLKIDRWEISVVIADEDFIRTLNRDFRGKDSATDVLSFPQEESPDHPDGIFYAGDLVFCPAEIKANCEQFHEDEKTEWLRLCVHGILHLSGYTHDGYGSDDPMLKYQEEIVQELKERV